MNFAHKGATRMRSSNYLATVAGFGLIVLSIPSADAITIASPSGLGAGFEAINLTEPVHCRDYPHKIVGGHGWSKGCKEVIVREGAPSGASVNIQSGTSDRSGKPAGSKGGSTTAGSKGGSTTTNNNTTTNTGNTTSTGNTTTNTGTGAGATTSTSTKTGGATYTGDGAGATSTSTNATTTTGGTGASPTTVTNGAPAGGGGSAGNKK
jgi:hypothetical protein